jgi:porin
MARSWLLIASIALLLSWPVAGSASESENEGGSLWPVPDYTGDLWSRPALSGDWGGYRTRLADRGVTLSVDNISTFQGVLDGGLDEEGDIGGSLDYELHLDFQKLGLWPGAFVRVFAETQYGDFANANTGAALAANSDGLFPLPDRDKTTLTSVVYYQFLAEWFGLFLGKLDTLDGDANAFAGARGKHQFSNLNFVLNPVALRTVPYSALGGGFVVVFPEDRGLFNFVVLDANGQPNKAGFEDAFDDGTALSGEMRLAVELFGQPGHQLLGGTWSSRNFALLEQDLRILLFELITTRGITLDESKDSWSIYYNFDQYLFTEEGDREQGVGLFGRFGAADEETNPVELFLSFGIGGKGVIPGRDNDTFGIGYFYVWLSDDFPNPRDILDDSQGVEFFYNVEVTPWLHITPDLQIIDPALERLDTAFVGGVRIRVDL